MNLMTFLDCTSFFGNEDAGQTFLSIIGIARTVVRILQILVPIALIIWGSIDLGKAVIAGDEKAIKEAKKPFIQRVIAAVIVFLIPWLVGLVIDLVGSQEWHECWVEAKSYGLKTLPKKNTMGD